MPITNNQQTVLDRTIQVFNELGGSNNNTKATDRLRADLMLDSMDYVDVIVDLESEFEVSIDEDELEKTTTVGAVAALIEQKLRE
jgi:acyl carrier protein